MNFHGSAKPLTRDDVRAAANMLDVPEHVIWALRKVESAGKAFKNGRPIIAWEPHIFYRELPTSLRAQAVAADLAHPKWGVLPYLSTQSARYDQLERACAIDRAAALKSASWGAYQEMGFNFERSGFPNVEVFVEAMQRSEGDQLIAIAKFIRADEAMHDALKAEDWQEFARRYNGPSHAKNAYVAKFERWLAHYDGAKIAAESERIKRQPQDVADAKKAARDTVRDGVGFGVYLTAFWQIIGDVRASVDEAIEKLTGIQDMAPWVADTILVMTAVSAGLLILNGVRLALRKRDNHVLADASA